MIAAPAREESSLRELASLYGIQRAFYDVSGQRRRPQPQAVLGALKALGAPAERVGDAEGAARQRRLDLWRRRVEPAIAAWEGNAPALPIRLPAKAADAHIACRLEIEGGDPLIWRARWEELQPLRRETAESEVFEERGLPLPAGLPPGYHELSLELPGGVANTLVISAPARAYAPPELGSAWGVFLPLYALGSARDWGSGDFTGLSSLMDWVGGLGGKAVATLPLFACFLDGDEPFAYSPYMPASRLFWNEFYADVTRLPELADCQGAREAIASPQSQREIDEFRASDLVDFRRGMALKRRALAECARVLFSGDSPRRAEFESFVRARPDAEDYARFRATTERMRAGWRQWPERQRGGDIDDGDFDEESRRYHLYAQWVAEQQLASLSEQSRKTGVALNFDLPLGVHPDGYDIWRHREAFALGASAGAPPDAFFSEGQDWACPPLHPEGIREHGYAHLRSVLRTSLAHASVLRIDHVMGISRLYWVPEGMSAKQGVYVRYPEEELYAILCLESHRRRAMIVGEDLGTVPRYVEAALARRHIHRMYVLPFQLSAEGPKAPVRDSVASLNTHDMPPFAAFWERAGEHREALARFLERTGRLAARVRDAREVLRGCLRFLAESRSRLVLLNLEDLWLETRQQNYPGAPNGENWRRKARYRLEQMREMPEVVETMREVNGLRAADGGQGHAADARQKKQLMAENLAVNTGSAEGRSPFAGGLGVSPRFTSLNWGAGRGDASSSASIRVRPGTTIGPSSGGRPEA